MTNIPITLPTIKQLQCFLAVASELNFHRAAEKLHMTQPPLSRQIQGLEQIIGQSLIYRDTHQVYLTDAGVRFEQEANLLIAQLMQVVRIMHIEKTKVKIGMTRTINFSQIPFINNILSKFSDLNDLSNPSLTSKHLLQMLEQNKLDIALVGERTKQNQYSFEFYKIYKESLRLAMPSSHLSSLKKTVNLKELRDFPLYWFTRNSNPSYFDKCELYFNKQPYKFRRIAEPSDSLIMLADIAKGNAIALMPKSMCLSKIDGLSYRSLDSEAEEELSIDIYLAIRNAEKKREILAVRDLFLKHI